MSTDLPEDLRLEIELLRGEVAALETRYRTAVDALQSVHASKSRGAAQKIVEDALRSLDEPV